MKGKVLDCVYEALDYMEDDMDVNHHITAVDYRVLDLLHEVCSLLETEDDYYEEE